MKLQRTFIFLLLALCACVFLAAKAKKAEKTEPLRIHMISGSEEYESAKSLPAFKAFLEKRYHVVCTMSMTTDKSKELPNIEKLDEADVLLVFCRRVEPPEAQLAHVKKWCEAGKPVIGLRTASHAFQGWLEFDKAVLGGSYDGHGDEEAMKVAVEKKAAEHRVLSGVKPWKRSGKMYRNPELAKGVKVLLTGTTKTDKQPLAWVRTYDKPHKGRAFYTSMGYVRDFENENFRALLVNALDWVSKRKLEEKGIVRNPEV